MWDEDDPLHATDDSLYFSGTNNCLGFNNILDFIRIGEASLAGTSDVNYLNVSISPK